MLSRVYPGKHRFLRYICPPPCWFPSAPFTDSRMQPSGVRSLRAGSEPQLSSAPSSGEMPRSAADMTLPGTGAVLPGSSDSPASADACTPAGSSLQRSLQKGGAGGGVGVGVGGARMFEATSRLHVPSLALFEMLYASRRFAAAGAAAAAAAMRRQRRRRPYDAGGVEQRREHRPPHLAQRVVRHHLLGLVNLRACRAKIEKSERPDNNDAGGVHRDVARVALRHRDGDAGDGRDAEEKICAEDGGRVFGAAEAGEASCCPPSSQVPLTERDAEPKWYDLIHDTERPWAGWLRLVALLVWRSRRRRRRAYVAGVAVAAAVAARVRTTAL